MSGSTVSRGIIKCREELSSLGEAETQQVHPHQLWNRAWPRHYLFFEKSLQLGSDPQLSSAHLPVPLVCYWAPNHSQVASLGNMTSLSHTHTPLAFRTKEKYQKFVHDTVLNSATVSATVWAADHAMPLFIFSRKSGTLQREMLFWQAIPNLHISLTSAGYEF